MGGRAEQVAGPQVKALWVEQRPLQALAVQRLGELLAPGAVGRVHRGHQLLGAADVPQTLE